MDSLELLSILECVVILLFGVVNCLITRYIAVHETQRFKVVGVMFSFLSAGCLFIAVAALMTSFRSHSLALPISIIGSMSVSSFISANLLVLFFWVNFVGRFFSKVDRQQIVDRVQLVALIIINAGHLAFGITSFYFPSSSLLLVYRIIMITLIILLEIVLIVLGIVLWHRFHTEIDKGFYHFARKIAKVLLTVGSVGILWVLRYALAMNTYGDKIRLFADAMVSFTITVVLLVVYLNFFGRRYLLAIFVPSMSHQVPPISPPMSDGSPIPSSPSPSSPSLSNPNSPRRYHVELSVSPALEFATSQSPAV